MKKLILPVSVGMFAGLLVLMSLMWALYNSYGAFSHYEQDGAITPGNVLYLLMSWVTTFGTGIAGTVITALLSIRAWGSDKVTETVAEIQDSIIKARPIVGTLLQPRESRTRNILDAFATLADSAGGKAAIAQAGQGLLSLLSDLQQIKLRGIEEAGIYVKCPNDGNPDTQDEYRVTFSKNKSNSGKA